MKISTGFLLLIIPGVTQAASTPETSVNLTTWVINILLGFIILIMVFILKALKDFAHYSNPVAAKESFITGLIKKLTDTVPVEKEDVILTDHIYDGIQELDNNLPPWWKYLFYATIVFSAVYIYFYHFSENGKLQIQEYEQEMVIAEKEIEQHMKLAANSIDENNVTMADLTGIEKGKSLYIQNCAACHGKEGEGGVGPNLTDEFWLHGGGVKNIFKTIKYGVPQKGMISWKASLSPANIKDVSSYIMSIKGTTPTNAKEPQGEKYDDKDLAIK